jgi:hypothetical protein
VKARKAPRGPSVLNRPMMTYGDLSAMAAARKGLATLPDGSGESSMSENRGDSWDGGVQTLAAAAAMLDAGWEAGNAAVARAMDLVAGDDSPTGGWSMEVAGLFPSIAAYVSGDPECMYMPEEGPTPRRVRILISPCYHCGIQAKAAMEYAKATAAMVSMFMARGLDVAVTAVHVINAGDVKIQMPVQVKDYGQECDASRLAFSTHPAMLRRVLFCRQECDGDLPVEGRNWGYGTPSYSCADVETMRTCLGPDAADERIIALPALSECGDNLKADGYLAAFDKHVEAQATLEGLTGEGVQS